MRIPKFIKIGKHKWKVILDSNKLDTEKYNGLCDPNSREILIDPGLSRNELEETFLHEFLHALFPLGVVTLKIEEKIVGALAKSLLDSLNKNGLTISAKRKTKKRK